jgi:hypothetical protein
MYPLLKQEDSTTTTQVTQVTQNKFCSALKHQAGELIGNEDPRDLIAKAAHLQDNYWNRFHEDYFYEICNHEHDDITEVSDKDKVAIRRILK